jgi:hypothetical protein
MKNSNDLLRDIEYELVNPRHKSPMREYKPVRLSDPLRSEVLADQLLEKIRTDKEKFSIECRKIKNQILQILGDDNKKPY